MGCRNIRTAARAAVCALFFLVLSGVLFSEAARGEGEGLKAFEKDLVAVTHSAMPFCVKIQVLRPRRNQPPLRPGRETNKTPALEAVSLSGILLDGEGHAATLGEALKGARRVLGFIFDGKEEHLYKARVVGFSDETDIGVIKLEGDGVFKAPVLAESARVPAGSLALGLGFPFDLGPGPSVSVGIVSATGRSFSFGEARYTNLIETSFSVRPGETGGPVVNSDGEVIGLLLTSYRGSSSWSPRGGIPLSRYSSAGVSLVIPAETLEEEVQRILDKQGNGAGVSGTEPAPWLGIVAENIDNPVLREQVHLAKGGVMVWHVYASQPAALADIRRHDILVKWNGRPIQGLDHLMTMISEAGVGKRVDLVLIRKGKEIKKTIVIGGS